MGKRGSTKWGKEGRLNREKSVDLRGKRPLTVRIFLHVDVPPVDQQLGPVVHRGLDEVLDVLLRRRRNDRAEVGVGLDPGRHFQTLGPFGDLGQPLLSQGHGGYGSLSS